jgi:23S rRNA (cytosine1962-C5)-methyltransferase
MSLPTIFLPAELNKPLQRGHPWAYRDQVSNAPRLASGTWVHVQCGKFQAYGLWDAGSPIAVRIFSRQGVPDARWIEQRVREAWEGREPLRREGTTAYRWLYGEGDGIPGVVVDLYNDYAVVQTYADSLDALLPWIVDGLKACTRLKGVLLRQAKEGAVQALWGRLPQRAMIVEENGLRMRVNVFEGQKTGLFLDHRANRQYLEPWCAGKRVLNCFAYTGAFALYAIRGGAKQVISADIVPQAAEETRRNLEINGFDPDEHPFVVTDCFELLEEYASRGERFDLIVLDPPTLARSKKSQYVALRAYTRLNQAAMRCLPPGGLLATASCTSQVSPQAFRQMLADAAARARKRLLILHEAGQAIDHPVPAHFPEGRYLKFVVGRIGEVY